MIRHNIYMYKNCVYSIIAREYLPILGEPGYDTNMASVSCFLSRGPKFLKIFSSSSTFTNSDF
jgi:hypothetical protein